MNKKSVTRPTDKTLERKFIGGLIHNGIDAWVEFSAFIKEDDFVDDVNKQIFRVCSHLLDENSELNSTIIASRCKNLGISIGSGDLMNRIDDMLLAPLSKKGTIEAAKDLVAIAFRRREIDTLREAAEYVSSYDGNNISEMISERDRIISSNVEVAIQKYEPINIAEIAYEKIEEWGNGEDSYAIKTPWETFNKAFQGFEPKEAYCFAGRPSHGKSGMMLSLAHQCANDIEENFIDGKRLPVLYLDTELTVNQQIMRWGAMSANIDPFLLRWGDWRRNPECVEKVRTVLKNKKNTDNFHHVFVPGVSINEIRSIIKRWVAKNCGNEVGIIVYDYLKVSGSELKGAQNPRLEMAYKLDLLKDEIKENTNCTFLFGAQRNRHGDDDDSSIAESDHIQQLASFTALIKKKSLEERAEQPTDLFGTHQLIPTKFGRAAGRGVLNFENPVQINKKWTNNWINLDFSNFRFEERGDGREVKDYLELQKSNKKQDKSDRVL